MMTISVPGQIVPLSGSRTKASSAKESGSVAAAERRFSNFRLCAASSRCCASEVGPLAASAEHGDLLGYETQPLVSTDYINDVRSSIVDAASTMMVGDKMLKIYAWYDNEAGYSMRTAELARLVARKFF